MTTRPQPEPHLDADQLNAFAEGALSASARTLCLQHLAECAHCREVAFLAGASAQSEEPAFAPPHSWRWSFTRWPVLSLGAAALAAAIITAVLLHHTHQTVPPTTVQIATESSISPRPEATAAPMNQTTPSENRVPSVSKPTPAQKASPKPAVPSTDNGQSSGAALDSITAPAQPSAAVAQQQATAEQTVRPASNMAEAPATAQPARAPAAGLAKAAPSSTPRNYSESYLRSPDGFAQISGTITDRTGATVAHAKITLNQASGTAHRETFTDAAGRFAIGSLQPGKYQLEISSPGFVTQAREVELGTSQLARTDSELTVGSAAETVTVQAAAPTVNTESASVQSILPNKQTLKTSVSIGERTLALDTAGGLSLSTKAGKHAKAIRGPWKKAVVTSLSLTPNQQFKVTTAQDSWLSADGEHWHTEN